MSDTEHSCTLLPLGLHPQLVLAFPSYPPPPPKPKHGQCVLYALLNVPPSLIVDRHQLMSLVTSGELGHEVKFGGKQRDIELPSFLAEPAGDTNLLIRLSDKRGRKVRRKNTVVLHTRYPLPAVEEGSEQVDASLRCPLVFWACDEAAGEVEGCEAASYLPPGLLAALPYPTSTKLHFLPSSASTRCPSTTDTDLLSISVPTGSASDLGVTQSVTVVLMWLGLVMLGWAVRGAKAREDRARTGKSKTE